MTINWTLTTLKIKDLKPHPSNPRILTKHAADNLQASIDCFGLVEKPIVNLDNIIIGGHQRISLLKKQKIKQVECWIPDRLLDETEVNELMIRLNKNTGAWDWDILSNQFEMEDLSQWGFTDSDFIGRDIAESNSDINLPNSNEDKQQKDSSDTIVKVRCLVDDCEYVREVIEKLINRLKIQAEVL